jgi:hypothetical protein
MPLFSVYFAFTYAAGRYYSIGGGLVEVRGTLR